MTYEKSDVTIMYERTRTYENLNARTIFFLFH